MKCHFDTKDLVSDENLKTENCREKPASFYIIMAYCLKPNLIKGRFCQDQGNSIFPVCLTYRGSWGTKPTFSFFLSELCYRSSYTQNQFRCREQYRLVHCLHFIESHPKILGTKEATNSNDYLFAAHLSVMLKQRFWAAFIRPNDWKM